MSNPEREFRYVPCSRLSEYLSLGWLPVGHYRTFGNNEESFILEWICGCPSRIPRSPPLHEAFPEFYLVEARKKA